MNARRDSPDGPEAASIAGRALLVGAVAFAAAATALLVLTDQEKWLRLGIVAALWAALTGGFLAARYRRQVTDQREALAERQRIYELELEREIAARREHELTVEAEAKRKAEETSRDDIAALRGELQNLRQTLEGLMGGEFLVERYALQAEATRMRSLAEDRSLSVRRDVKHLPAAQIRQANVVIPPVVREAETELIERVREQHQKQRPARPEPRVVDSRPPSQPRRTDRPVHPERVTPEQASSARQPAPRQPHPAEMSDRWFMPDGLAESQPPSRAEQSRRQEPQRPADPAPRRGVTPGWSDGTQERGASREEQLPAAAGHQGTPAPSNSNPATSYPAIPAVSRANSSASPLGSSAVDRSASTGSYPGMPAVGRSNSAASQPVGRSSPVASQPGLPAVGRSNSSASPLGSSAVDRSASTGSYLGMPAVGRSNSAASQPVGRSSPVASQPGLPAGRSNSAASQPVGGSSPVASQSGLPAVGRSSSAAGQPGSAVGRANPAGSYPGIAPVSRANPVASQPGLPAVSRANPAASPSGVPASSPNPAAAGHPGLPAAGRSNPAASPPGFPVGAHADPAASHRGLPPAGRVNPAASPPGLSGLGHANPAASQPALPPVSRPGQAANYPGYAQAQTSHPGFPPAQRPEQGSYPGSPVEQASHPASPAERGSYSGLPAEQASYPGFPPVQASSPGFPPARPEQASRSGFPGEQASYPGFPAVQASHPGFPPAREQAGNSGFPSLSTPAQDSGTHHAAAPNAGAPLGGRAEQTSWLAQYNQQGVEPTYGSRAYVPQQARQQPDQSSLRNVWQQVNPPPVPTRPQEGGHRHRAEEGEDSGGGRRRRAEGQPSWQETVAKGAEESGSHTSGRSVSELLANHGLDANPRRRRRRED
jgi:uncharacterized protein DUF6779